MTKSIQQQVHIQLGELERKGREPAVIVFNTDGYQAAMVQDCNGTMFGVRPDIRTYMGLPWTIDRSQDVQAKVTDTSERAGAVRLHLDGPLSMNPHGTQTVSLLSRALTVPQMCELIDQFNHAPKAAGQMTEFREMLDRAVRNYGSFE